MKIIFLFSCLFYTCFVLAQTNTIQAPATPWRTTDDIINGWDWSLPAGIKPVPYSGVTLPWPLVQGKRYNVGGNELTKVNATWRELEPEEGKYNFEPLRKRIVEAGKNWDGIILKITGSVFELKNFPERPDAVYPPNWLEHEKLSNESAPQWLEKYNIAKMPGRPRFNLQTPFQIINYNVFDDNYHKRYLKFVEAFGKSGIPQMQKVFFSYLHFASGSRGEEGDEMHITETDTGKIKYKERIKAWAGAFKNVEYKLAMVSNKGEALDYAYQLGMGQRNGFVDMVFQDANNAQVGQVVDSNGYMTVNENLPPIKENRAFGDENEEYGPAMVPRFGPIETFPDRYRDAMLRTLQMRRNFVWLESNMIDPPLANYVSVELGRNINNTPDIWCYLKESVIANNGKPLTVKNFERWLYQRDQAGHIAAPDDKVEIAKTMAFRLNDYRYDYTARRTDIKNNNNSIDFAVDDRFLKPGAHKVAIKITFHDKSKARWALLYNKGAAQKEITCNGNGEIRTATFFLNDAVFDAPGMGYDFEIKALEGDAVIKFVRVIRLD